MSKQRFWLSYDICEMDYDEKEKFYKWLANNMEDINECAGSLVTFLFDGDRDKLTECFKKEEFDENDRIYIITYIDNKPVGKFIAGRGRKISNLWDKYLTINSEDDVDEAF